MIPPPGGASRFPRIGFGFALIALCCLLLGYIASVERAWLEGEPWAFATAQVTDAPAPVGALPARFRKLPPEARPPDTPVIAALRAQFTADAASDPAEADAMLDLLGANLSETIIMLPAGDWSRMLESGRLPQPGRPEVLMGDLARMQGFTLDGVHFEAVGRLKAAAGGFAFAYLLPHDPALAAAHFASEKGGRAGWFLPDVRQVDREALEREEGGAEPAPPSEQPVQQTRTRPAYAYGGIIALIIGALGGYLFHAGLLARYAARSALCADVACRPRLFLATHLVLYGTFFVSMHYGAQLPLNNIAISHFVYDQFTTGGLKYIGDAYASGDILDAAVATFRNNYVLQTLVLTLAVSLVPLGLGIVKTGLSFVLTGFAMAPMWTGTASGYAYHAITMVFELEAYIIACFAVACWTLSLWGAVFTPLTGAPGRLRHAFRAYLEAAVLTGLLLAAAALYEALTLILLGGTR